LERFLGVIADGSVLVFAQSAAAFAFLKFFNTFQQMYAAKIRPQVCVT
jgi:hypothetical protein